MARATTSLNPPGAAWIYRLIAMPALIYLSVLLAPVNLASQQTSPGQQPDNLLAGLSSGDLSGFQFMNPPESVQFLAHGIRVRAEKGTDFFVNPEDGSVQASAPFLYREVEGDFVATALVKPDFSSTWNACALMAYADSTHWIKFAFENSDATGKSIVTVVTDGISDDANGVILDRHESIWLKLIRKGDQYAMHWSEDGKEFVMARISTLPGNQSIRVGLEAQSPLGPAADHTFLFLDIEQVTVSNLRLGQ